MADRVADLLLERGNARANAIASRGKMFGDAVQGATFTFGNVLQQHQQAQAAARAKQMVAEEFTKPEGPSLANLVQVLGPEQAIALFSEHAKTLPKPKEDFTLGEGQTRFGPSGEPIANVPKPEPTPQGFTLGEGQTRFDAQGQPVANVPKPEPQPPKPGTEEYAIWKMATDLGKRVEDLTEAQVNTARRRHAAATRFVEPKTGSQPGWQWVMRGKQQIYTNEVQPGDIPASRSGGGRNVTSGDAGRMADFDTSLSDLSVLDATLTETKGATGTSAQIGAAMPAWATDLFGWGVDAKKRQGVIDRVKQVIGKTLEGGVLRKEDEIKYERILPTIKDTADVAKSKLAGLKTAIAQRRETFLSNLEDAGFDVSKFPAEPRMAGSGGTVPAAVTQALSSVGPGRHTLSDGSVWIKGADGSVTRGQ